MERHDKKITEYHLAVFGATGVGKSALTFQLLNRQFVEDHDPTIEDVYRKQFEIDQEPCLLNVLDTGGEDEFTGSSTAGFNADYNIRRSQGLVCVFSITDRRSFEEIRCLFERVRNANVALVLVGNKCDLEHQRAVPTSEASDWAKSFGCKYLETSAKSFINVDACFFELVRVIRENNSHDKESLDSKAKKECFLS